MTLYWLATGNTFESVCSDFCAAASTARKWIKITIIALHGIRNDFIKFPVGDELKRVIDDFEGICKLPNVAGAIDGTIVELLKPTEPFQDRYWCYKNKIGIIVLAVVDAVGRFTFIDAGRPASVGDVNAFRLGLLKPAIENRTVMTAAFDRVITGTTIPPYLLGDEAFSQARYMMTIYPGTHAPNSRNAQYNGAIIAGRRVVEQAFGRCKHRWRILLNGSTCGDPDFLGRVTTVCCALHNYCETEKLNQRLEGLPEAWFTANVNMNLLGRLAPTNVVSSGEEVRSALRDYLWDRLAY